MNADLLSLVAIISLGVGAQWLSWRLHLPTILLLLVFGVLVGPVTGFIDPDELVGDLLFPGVSFGVALILFEGGLSLRLAEVRDVGTVVWRLISIGALVTWVLATITIQALFGLGLEISLLLGSIFIVTGPTVIVPLLRQVRLTQPVSGVLKWEGILIDPVGAILAVLVFEGILAGTLAEATSITVLGLLRAAASGALIGVAGAAVLSFMLRRYYLPDYLQNPVVFMAVGAVLVASNALADEAGLLAVMVMGIVLATRKTVPVRSILEFKENLRVLLISTLFIVLAARLEAGQLQSVLVPGSLLVASLVLVVRPLSVLASTLGSALSWRERVMVMATAPRGILAAAVASIFALELAHAGYEQASAIVPITFFTIAGTIGVYSLAVPLLSRALGMAGASPQGILMLGAQDWACHIADVLQKQGFKVLVVDANYLNVRRARMDDLPAYYGNIMSERAIDNMNLDGIGRLLALTPNDEANSLASVRLNELFGRSEVYQLAPGIEQADIFEHWIPVEFRGRLLFGKEITYAELSKRFAAGERLKATRLTEEFGIDEYTELYGEAALPLFLVRENGELAVFAVDNRPQLKAGDQLIALVKDPDEIGASDGESAQSAKTGG